MANQRNRRTGINREGIVEVASLEPMKPPIRLAYQVGAFCNLVGISRSHFYRLVKKGEIKTVRLGTRTLVPACEVERLLAVSGQQS